MYSSTDEETGHFWCPETNPNNQSIYQDLQEIDENEAKDYGSFGSLGKADQFQNKKLARNNSIQRIDSNTARKLSDICENDYMILAVRKIQESVRFLNNQILLTEHPFFVMFNYEKEYYDQAYELYITNYRILLQYEGELNLEFSLVSEQKYSNRKICLKRYRSIPLGYLEALDSIENFLLLRNGMKLYITGLGNQLDLCKKISESVNQIPFYMIQQLNQEKQVYDSLAEIQRMGIRWKKYSCVQNKNRHGEKVCSSYPRFFTIPKKIEKNYLKQALMVWHQKRVPVLIYHHFNNEACIWRSAKLEPGKVESQESIVKLYLNAISPTYVRLNLLQKDKNRSYSNKQKLSNSKRKFSTGCEEQYFESSKTLKQTLDQLIFSYLKMNEQSNNLSQAINANDQRVKTGKMQAKSTNKFQQNLNLSLSTFKSAYQQMIPNIRSGTKIENQKFTKILSRWYENIDSLITCAYKISAFIIKGQHVIIQESYNTNRASQIIALAQVLLDPFYRTFRGFSVLIEKEFICHLNSNSVVDVTANKLNSSQIREKTKTGYLNPKQNLITVVQNRSSTDSNNLHIFSYENYNNKQGNHIIQHQNQLNRVFSKNTAQKYIHSANESSPLLIQFLQCLNQLINAYPQKFQYSGSYLARVGYELYSRKFSNFQCFDYKRSTQQGNQYRNSSYRSIWHHMNKKKSYYNYQWKINQKRNKHMENLGNELPNIRSKPSVKQYCLWKQYYDLVGYFQGQEIREQQIDNKSTLYNLLKRNQSKRESRTKVPFRLGQKQDEYCQIQFSSSLSR